MDRGKQKTDFQPDLVKKSFDLVMEQFMEHEFLPSIARLPFVYTGATPDQMTILVSALIYKK